jgi:hypothetical protein
VTAAASSAKTDDTEKLQLRGAGGAVNTIEEQRRIGNGSKVTEVAGRVKPVDRGPQTLLHLQSLIGRTKRSSRLPNLPEA